MNKPLTINIRDMLEALKILGDQSTATPEELASRVKRIEKELPLIEIATNSEGYVILGLRQRTIH